MLARTLTQSGADPYVPLSCWTSSVAQRIAPCIACVPDVVVLVEARTLDKASLDGSED